MTHFLRLSTILLILACLAGGCSDGDSYSSPSGSTGSGNTNNVSGTLQGLASKGPVANGTVRVFSVDDDGNQGALLAEGRTNADGTFSVALQEVNIIGAVRIEISGGTYISEYDGGSVTLPRPAAGKGLGNTLTTLLSPGEALRALEGLDPVSVSPLTSILDALTTDLLQRGNGANSFSIARDALLLMVGLDELNFTLPDLTQQALASASPGSQVAILNAAYDALNEKLIDLANANGNIAGGFDGMRALIQDATDGVLDGQLQGQPIRIGEGTFALSSFFPTIGLMQEVNTIRSSQQEGFFEELPDSEPFYAATALVSLNLQTFVSGTHFESLTGATVSLTGFRLIPEGSTSPPALTTLQVGQSRQFHAVMTQTFRKSGQTSVISTDITETVEWSSSDPSEVTVSRGLVEGIAPGGAEIRALNSLLPLTNPLREATAQVAVVAAAQQPGSLEFTEQPGDVTLPAGVDVQVRALDDNDQPMTQFTGVVRLTLQPSGTVEGASFVETAAVAGVASFHDLDIDPAGTYTFAASANGFPNQTSDPFVVSPAASGVRTLSFVTQPGDQTPDRLFTVQVEMLLDGTRDTAFSGAIDIAKASGSGSGSLQGTLSENAVNGLATFTLSVDDLGSYSLDASSTDATGDTSDSFQVTAFGINSPSNVAVADRPLGIDIGDFDGDGDPDLVTANGISQNASLLFNNGSGTFSGLSNQAIGQNSPEDVAMADFNSDGRDDFVVAGQSSTGAHVLMQQSDGSFVLTSLSSGNGPIGVATGDIDQDGRPDFVIANVNDADISVYLQLTLGTFTRTDFATNSNSPNAVAIGDVNGDGRPDIVVDTFDGDVCIFEQTTTPGSFGAPDLIDVTAAAEDVVLAFINSDARLDIAVATTNDQAQVLLQNADGSFTRTGVGAGDLPVAIAAGDLNGDGRMDLAVGNLLSDDITMLLQDSGGGFDATSLAADNGPRAVQIWDLNDDGRLDIVSCNENSDNVSVLLQQ